MEDFHPGDLVWFDPGVGYNLPGEVVEFSRPAQVVTVQAIISGKPQSFTIHKPSTVKKRQDLGPDGVEDMIQIGDLNEASLLWNLKIRYDKELIYTYTGSILVAVNPYKMFDIYGVAAVKKYEGQILGTLPPHLFAISSAAYSKMSKDCENQVVVISGESGAGKTESTKLILQYLAAVNRSNSNVVTEQILEASPLLESFGNAKTVKNDNSSRFGKYMEVYFKDGVITGAKTTDYLLEKSRIVTQASDERNYHVFYELLAGLSDSEREKYGLQTSSKYFYLNQGCSAPIPGKNDAEDFRSLLSAMQVLGFSSEEQDSIFRVLASVLHIGNVYFHRKPLKHGQEGVEVGSEAEIRWASHLLQLSTEGILKALTTKTTEARNERMMTPLNIDQALDARDAIAKALYSGLFSWLVQRINQIVCKGSRKTSIAILDIFGFEDFKENSFEQLCINYANENLQYYFNKHVFKLEQAEYAREKIEWQPITYPDNHAALHLISKKPVGILHLLDDESNFPKATDLSFLEKCHYNHALNELYSRPRMSSMEFGIRHYAGQVWYSVDGFLDKNRDTLRSDVVDLLISSKVPMISKIFQYHRESLEAQKTVSKANGRFVTMKPRAPTVAAGFHDSLHTLVDAMSRCNPWFVRCIKPNNEKAPMKLDMLVVLEQLRYSGMLETIRIRKIGYPIRFKFQVFADRYRCLAPGRLPRGAPAKEVCRVIMDRVQRSRDQFQLGTTKVFLREAMEQALEQERVAVLRSAIVVIQRHVRGFLARRHYRAMKKSAVKIQSTYRGYVARRNYKTVRKGVVRAQANYRMLRQKREYDKIKAILARKREADRLALERAKERMVRDEQERVSRAVAGVNHLEIPAELAFIFTKLDDWHCPQNERNVSKATGQVARRRAHLPRLPPDIDQHAFTKFTNIYFKSHIWGMKREPIRTPFLAKSNDGDHQESLALFKLILRFMNDNHLSGQKERVLGDYIVQRGLQHQPMRDEILCQLCNQTWQNDNEPNKERGWLLMANCLSCFPPSKTLYKYLLKYISDHGHDGYAPYCQHQMLRLDNVEPQNARTYPPCLLEWKANTKKMQMALEARFPDDSVASGAVDSWTTGEEFAAELLRSRGLDEIDGWTVDLLDNGSSYELNGSDYVLDLISEMEIAPAFPVCKSYFLVSPDRSKGGDQPQPVNGASWITSPHNPDRYNTYEVDLNELPPAPPIRSRPMEPSVPLDHRPIPVPPPVIPASAHMPHSVSPQPSSQDNRRRRKHHEKSKQVERKRELLERLEEARANSLTEDGSLDRRNIRFDHHHHERKPRSRSLENLLDGPPDNALSKHSALNGRYFDADKPQQHLDDLIILPLSEKSRLNQRYLEKESHPAWQRKLGLSTSALNERYFHGGGTPEPSDIVIAEDMHRRRPSPSTHDGLSALNGHTNGPSMSYDTPVPSEPAPSPSPSSNGIDFPEFDIGEIPVVERDNDQDTSRYSRTTAESTRYVKYAGRQSHSRTHSHSTKAYIGRSRDSDYGIFKGSAMSDTSEAPSLASHVRNVRIPSHTSDLDQYLDELFNPVLDGNLDEMSDARSLAASIKGGGNDEHEYDDLDVLRNAELLSEALKGGGGGVVDSDSEGESLGLSDAEVVSKKLKGGGQAAGGVETQTSTALPNNLGLGLNLHGLNPGLLSPPLLNMSGANTSGISQSVSPPPAGPGSPPSQINYLPLYNVSGMTVPMVDASQLIQQQVLQQHMMQLQQRAFLASAVQQNLQIQQQLMQQSAALQQLLQSSVVSPTSPTANNSLLQQAGNGSNENGMPNVTSPLSTTLPLSLAIPPGLDSGWMPPQGLDGFQPGMHNRGQASGQKIGGPSPKDTFGNVLSELRYRAGGGDMGGISYPPGTIPPPPPPPPPPLSPNSLAKYPDVYGRAKTVRIGKWRWPPPRDGSAAPPNQQPSHLEFKIKKQSQDQRHGMNGNLPDGFVEFHEIQYLDQPGSSSQQMNVIASQQKLNNGSPPNNTSTPAANKKSKDEIIRAFDGDNRPDPGSIGKLRISSEMKAKLEQLTMDHSVRSKTSQKDNRARVFPPSTKIDEDRKLALERQLTAGWQDQPDIAATRRWAAPEGKSPSSRLPPPSAPSTDAPPSFRVDNLVKSKIEQMERQGRDFDPRFDIQYYDQSSQGTRSFIYEESLASSRSEIERHHPPPPALVGAAIPRRGPDRSGLGPPPPPPIGPNRKSVPPPAPSSIAASSSYYAPSTPVVPRHREPPPPIQPSNYLTKSASSDHIEFEECSEFLKPVDSAPPQAIRTGDRHLDNLKTKLFPVGNATCITYTRVAWELRIRKEVFSPNENLENPLTLHLVFCQIVKDVYGPSCIRLTKDDTRKLRTLIDGYGVTPTNIHAPGHKIQVKRNIVDVAKELPTYFCRLFPVSGGRHLPNVQMLGVSHSGIRLVKRERDAMHDYLNVLDTIGFDDIADVTSPRACTVQILLRNGGWMTVYSPKATQIQKMIHKYSVECVQGGQEYVRAVADYITTESTLLSFRKGDIIRLTSNRSMHLSKGWLYGMLDTGESGIFPCEYVVPLSRQPGVTRTADESGDVIQSGSSISVVERAQMIEAQSSLWIESKEYIEEDDTASEVVNGQQSTDGKYSILQFAMFNFRESLDRYEMLRSREGSVRGSVKMIENLKSKKKNKKSKDSDWTWREMAEMIKFSKSPIQASLLNLENTELSKLAVECFLAVMRYMGDYPMSKNQSEVDSVYSVLVNCHKYPLLRDEVYCQIIKQTTNNKSSKPDSCQRGWRLFSIIAAYFDCSDNLKPYLFKYLETAAYDKRRAYHGTAMVCLQNLRKTFKYGGRKNVPSIEEIAAISAGRNSKRQMYRLPGGTERVINTKSTTVVEDIIDEICSILGVRHKVEMEEFSLYCIVEGDPFTMPLSREEYILDVTTELLKNGHVFYLIFCRSVWYFPLRLDNQLYIEVIFNQVAPDYLEGLLLVIQGEKLPEGVVADIARVAALLHRAADMQHVPSKDEVKYLLPKPVLPMKDIKPPQWVELVQRNWADMMALITTEAKAQCLDILQRWPLFGSCFFAVKWIRSESTQTEHILALNKEGIHFLDVVTHESVWMYPFSEVISTRKVRAEDGTLFLDMKCGNLMVQKITRIQTDQAHEISRLVRQYINIQQSHRGANQGDAPQDITLSRPH